jgi:hypothetical protein
VQEYLPEDHLARFVVEIVDQLDLSHLVAAYAGTGSRPYHPAMLVALLFYGYATGVFSSRKLAQATYDSIAFRFICANTHPDHRTIADFRKRFLDELAALCKRPANYICRDHGLTEMIAPARIAATGGDHDESRKTRATDTSAMGGVGPRLRVG